MNEIDKSLVQRHRANERVLAEHMEEFVKVGLALKDIRDSRSYKLVDDFKTFEDYCKKKWDLSRPRAYQLMDAAEIRLKLPDIPSAEEETSTTGRPGWNERQVRQLGRLGSPTRARAVAERVIKEIKAKKANGEKVRLGSVVRKHVEKELGENHKPKPKEDPMFSDVVFRYTGEIDGMAAVIEDIDKEDLELFGKTERYLTQDFASAIERLARAWGVPMSAAQPAREK